MSHSRSALTAVLLLALSRAAGATAQIPEEIIIDGKPQMLFSEPLDSFLIQDGNHERLKTIIGEGGCTAAWRGYRGTWEVRSDQLLLTHLVADPCKEVRTSIPLERIFPLADQPVLAAWYTGLLVIPTGKLLKYVHLGYQSQYEKYIVLTVSNGKVTSRREESSPPE